MSMAFSCAGARLHGRMAGLGGPKCRPSTAGLVWRRGTSFRQGARRSPVAGGVRADLVTPPRANADGGAPAAVVVPEAEDVVAAGGSAEETARPGVVPETRGADVDDGAGGNGKFPPGEGGGGGGDGDSGGEGDEGEDEFGPILSFEQVVQEAEKRCVSLPSLPADMVEAAKSVGIQKLLLLRYLDMQVTSCPRFFLWGNVISSGFIRIELHCC
jgi:hypothetical protein